jgi:hypothetical protein
MAKADLEEFYDLVAVGDQVQIIGQPNEQTARFFAAPLPAPAAAASKPETELAKAEPAATQNDVARNVQKLTGGTR